VLQYKKLSGAVGAVGGGRRVDGRIGQGRVRGSIGGIGGGSRCDEFLKLFSGLIATGDSTASGAFLKGKGDVIGDLIGNHLDLGFVDAKSGRENISRETKESLGDCIDAWERIPEEGDEGDRLTTVVELEMDGTLGEESGLELENLVVDELNAVLGDEARNERAVSDKIELWGSWMGMGSVKTTRSKETGSD